MTYLAPTSYSINTSSKQAAGLVSAWNTALSRRNLTTLPDIVGHSPAAFTDAPVWDTSPEVPNYLRFVGGSSNYMTIPYSPRFATTKRIWSVSAWILVTAGNGGFVIAQNANTAGWGVSVNAADGLIIIFVKRAAATAVQRVSVAAVDDGVWHHVLVMINTISPYDIDIYIDNVLSQGALTLNGAPVASTSSLELGRRSIGNYYTGGIADVRFYDGDKGYLAPDLFNPRTRWELYEKRSLTWLAATLAPVTTTVQLDWTDLSENEDGFSIERAEDAGAFAEIDTVGVGIETYNNVNVPTGHTYHYRVRAISAALGYSEYSNEADVIV